MSQKIKKKRHCTLTRGRKIAEKDKAMFCTRKCTLKKKKKCRKKEGQCIGHTVLSCTLTLDKIGGNVQYNVLYKQHNDKNDRKRGYNVHKKMTKLPEKRRHCMYTNKMTKNSRKSD